MILKDLKDKKDLEQGDVVQHKGSGRSYTVNHIIHLADGTLIPIITRTQILSNVNEWRVLEK